MRFFIPIFCFLVLTACSKDDEQSTNEREAIVSYLEANNLTATETESGLFFNILKEGDGRRPSENDLVQVAYKGMLLNGNVFDESAGTGTVFRLRNLIAAWREGLPKIKSGGSIVLYCPSNLAYGNRETSGIPANSTLIFEIDLKAVFD